MLKSHPRTTKATPLTNSVANSRPARCVQFLRVGGVVGDGFRIENELTSGEHAFLKQAAYLLNRQAVSDGRRHPCGSRLQTEDDVLFAHVRLPRTRVKGCRRLHADARGRARWPDQDTAEASVPNFDPRLAKRAASRIVLADDEEDGLDATMFTRDQIDSGYRPQSLCIGLRDLLLNACLGTADSRDEFA